MVIKYLCADWVDGTSNPPVFKEHIVDDVIRISAGRRGLFVVRAEKLPSGQNYTMFLDFDSYRNVRLYETKHSNSGES